MTPSQLLNPPQTITKAQVLSAFQIVTAVAEAIREAGEIPSGTLYAMLIGKVEMSGYLSILNTLKGAGLIEERSHLLVWVAKFKGGRA